MATHKELLTVYQNKRLDLQKQLKDRTGSSDEETISLFDTLLHQLQQNERLLGEISSDNQALYNWLRYHAIQFKLLSEKFQAVSIREQHRFCQYMKEMLAVQMDTLPSVKQALLFARLNLVQLVLSTPDCGDEQLLVWIQSYLDHEVQILTFTRMWEKLKPSLHWQAQNKTKTPEETEDLLQETYVHALRYIRKHHKMPEEGKIKAWLATTMLHAFLDDVRDRGRLLTEPIMDEQAEQHVDEEDIEKTVIEEQEKLEIERILFSLSEEDRKVMALHLLRGMSLREIAEALGEKLETTRARFKRARPKILARLSAKSLAEYLQRFPTVRAKIQKLLQGYIPNKAAKGYNLADINVETEYEILVRYIVSWHVEGYDTREIAEFLTFEQENREAFEQRVIAVQTCLDENLPRLFSSFYGNTI